ncbi:hypothetical protein T484DRAFT_1860235 [Baffinella frigidus]|nr:hypothetical protein T484DRAFT_1860235 [Cryptophyta sp. CCMP2293]
MIKGKAHYMIKWKNYKSTKNTWEPFGINKDNKEFGELIKAFEASTPAKAAPEKTAWMKKLERRVTSQEANLLKLGEEMNTVMKKLVAGNKAPARTIEEEKTKSMARTERWMVTERNLQASISRHGDAGQQEAKNEWEEADRKLVPKRKAAATEVVMEASKFKWLWGRRLSGDQACIEAVVADAVDAAELGQLAEPSTWVVMRALQRLFNVKTLVGENLVVFWPPFFPEGGDSEIPTRWSGGRVSCGSVTLPPLFVGCTTQEEAGPGQILQLENELSLQ